MAGLGVEGLVEAAASFSGPARKRGLGGVKSLVWG